MRRDQSGRAARGTFENLNVFDVLRAWTAVLKTAVASGSPWVRIPPPPFCWHFRGFSDRECSPRGPCTATRTATGTGPSGTNRDEGDAEAGFEILAKLRGQVEHTLQNEHMTIQRMDNV